MSSSQLRSVDMSLYDMAKDAFKLAQKSDNIELIQKILDLQQQALAQQEEVVHLREENKKLKMELADMGTLEVFHGVYWRRLDDGQLDGPFSPQFWEIDRKLVRMLCFSTCQYQQLGVAHNFICTKSKQSYLIPVEFYSMKKIKNASELPTRPHNN